MALIEWTVSQIAYTPETYRVIYRQVTDDDNINSPQVSELVMGTSNLSAVNTLYSVVIRNLQPNSLYSYQISATNTQVTRFTQDGLFSTFNSGKFFYHHLFYWTMADSMPDRAKILCTSTPFLCLGQCEKYYGIIFVIARYL